VSVVEEPSTRTSVAKVIEITSESTESFEDAIARGIEKASETVEDIKAAWVKEQQVTVEAGKVVGYRVDLKVTFVVH
jgi:flavin-binding protein dodecin